MNMAQKTSIRANPSNLSLFARCRRGFKLQAIDRRGDEFPLVGAPLTMGANVHAALRDLFMLEPRLRNERKLLELLRDAWKKKYQGFKDDGERDVYWNRAKAALRRFAQTEDMSAQPVLIEENLYLDVDDFTISGKLDRVDRDRDGTHHVIDYKTGRQPPERLPLQIYSLLAANKYKTDELRASYLYLERNGDNWVTQQATREFIEEGLEEVRRQMGLIRAETEFAPTLTNLCAWCQFLKICPEAQEYLASRPKPPTDADLPIED